MKSTRNRIPYLAVMLSIPLLLLQFSCVKEKDGDNSFNLFTIQDDINLGNQIAMEIESDPVAYPLLDESQYSDAYTHLNRVVDAILNTNLVAYDNTFPWEAKIIHDDAVINAFATPGGHIYFYTGLIKELDNEAQFAGVAAHEIAHCARRHTTDQLTKAYGLSILISIVLGEDPSALEQLAADLAGGLASLAFSRKDEYEADEYAVKYLSSTTYHPLGLADFFNKLENMSIFPIFLSTHPSPEDRIEKINEAWETYGSKVGEYYEVRYQDFKNSLPN